MLNAFKLIWNFSSKRKKEYRNAIIFSFLEGLFLMAKMFAVIIAIYALFGRYPLSNAVIAVFALAVLNKRATKIMRTADRPASSV